MIDEVYIGSPKRMPKRLRGVSYVAGQIEATSIPPLVEQGVRFIVNNRPDYEEEGQPASDSIKAAADLAGIGYAHLPIAGQLDLQTVARIVPILELGVPTLLFCRSGSRSALLWAAAMAANGEDADGIVADCLNAGFDFRPYRATLDGVAAAFSKT